jgi:integrase
MLAMFPSVSPEIQQLVDAGVTARLGHSSIRTTQEIYAHMIHGQDDEAARKWEEYQLSNAPEKGSADA